jgi:uncharacterized integral membrane protein
LSGAARSAGSVFRKIIAAIILVPLGVIIIAFAVANRQIVTVSLDPFSAEHPAASLTLPLFALVIVLLVVGVLIGGIAAWLRQAKWRRTARRLEREIADLHIEVETLTRTAGMSTAGMSPGGISVPPAPPERLQLRPPLR